tara:strand:+ start:748 stop:948 length:201 start_codon:yes stop_codon:yes gene_type:complete
MLAASAAKANGKVCFPFIVVRWQQKTTKFKKFLEKFCESRVFSDIGLNGFLGAILSAKGLNPIGVL